MSKKDKDFSYPDPSDEDMLSKIFKKREFYFHRVPERDIMENYEEVEKYRAANCKSGAHEPREQQAILPNFISPNTPYKGLLLMHGVGSGKTMTAIRIAEQFKNQVSKYNTKIFVIVPGPNTKENFKNELIDTTGETYLRNKEALKQMTQEEIEIERRNALYNALKYYRILSYKSFYKKVLGEKIVEKKVVNDVKMKSTYRKTDTGEIERETVLDKITNMDNTLIIIDEAHNLSGNEYGEALKKIIKNSVNLRILLLTATPMINLADEIVDLLNFIRPEDDKIERDKVFTNDKNYLMKIKPEGLKYLQEKARGYISYYRGSIPYTFAKRVEKGKIPNGMLFTPVIKCYMHKFQYDTYIKTKENIEDTLDRTSTAAANFVYPGLNEDRTNIVGFYSTEGIINILAQLSSDGNKLRSLINKKLFNNKLTQNEENNFILSNENKNITGLILNLKYLKIFSIKFFKIIGRLNKLIEKKKGSGTAFVYSNLVKAGGIELFAETLIQNGYLEYREDNNYDIKNNTIDYKTGLTSLEYKKEKFNNTFFKPATFILITGGSEDSDSLPEVKQKVIKDVFNSVDNIDGKHIKFLLGSKVMNEGITLKNVKEVHILDAFFNIPKAEQVIGRAIRMCVHKDVINEDNKFPKVYIYRYVVALEKELSSDELLYQKAELKYLTVKEIERTIKTTAVDCPLLLHANVFPEELEKYKNCVEPTLENVNADKQICPALCDFKKCDLKCTGTQLNNEYWEQRRYKYLDKKEINYNTFNDELSKYEISLIKNKIKDLFKFKYIYLYNELLSIIKKSYLDHQVELFDNYFFDQALEDMMPKNENDFNNFLDTIYDKYNRSGYIIQRGKYYIYQPFNENEDVPMYYRQRLEIENVNQVSLNNYIKKNYSTKKFKDNNKEVKIMGYDFESTKEYYESREENFIIGVIDKNLNPQIHDNIDLFKIRPPFKKHHAKRGVGIITMKGTVCATSKDKDELLNLLKKLPNINKKDIDFYTKKNRENICDFIKEQLLLLEKYSTTKDNNKLTYIMIPADHPIYSFPYNLEDRIKFLKDNVKKLLDYDIEFKLEKDKLSYDLSFKNNKYIKDNDKKLEKLGFKLNNNMWSINIF